MVGGDSYGFDGSDLHVLDYTERPTGAPKVEGDQTDPERVKILTFRT